MSYDDGTCPVCLNFRYECVCPKDAIPEEVLLVPKKRSPADTVLTPKPEGRMAFTTEDANFIKMYEEKYPEMTAEFKRISSEQYIIFCKKNHAYGTSNIALGTSLSTPDDIKLSLSGLWFRTLDKINRLKSLVLLGQQDQVGESTADTYSDLSVYGIIGQIILRGKWGK